MGRSRRGSVRSAAQVCLALEECGQDFLAAAPHLAWRRSAEDRSLSSSSTRGGIDEANYRVPEDPGGGSPVVALELPNNVQERLCAANARYPFVDAPRPRRGWNSNHRMPVSYRNVTSMSAPWMTITWTGAVPRSPRTG